MSKATGVLNRVLVALDASSSGFETLETAVELAAQLHMELQGLFVEDVNLLHLAGLPFAQEIGFASPAFRPLSREAMERDLREIASRVREKLADLATRAQVPWSFQVTRGHAMRSPLECATTTDLLVLGPMPLATPLPRPTPLRRPTTKRRAANAVFVLYDGSPAADHSLAITLEWTRAWPTELVVVLCPDASSSTEELCRRAEVVFQEHARAVSIGHRAIHSSAQLIALVREQRPRMLFLNRDCRLFDSTALQSLVNEVGCPIGLIS